MKNLTPTWFLGLFIAVFAYGEVPIPPDDAGDWSNDQVLQFMQELEDRGEANSTVAQISRREYFDAPVKINVFLEPDYVTRKSKLVLQFLTITINGNLEKVFLTSGGRAGHGTARGTFSVHSRMEKASSATYGNAPMPWAHFFESTTNHPNAFGVHGTVAEYYKYLGTPASHGCVRLHQTNAKWLWDNTHQIPQEDFLVTVYRPNEEPNLSEGEIDSLYAKLKSDNKFYANVEAKASDVLAARTANRTKKLAAR